MITYVTEDTSLNKMISKLPDERQQLLLLVAKRLRWFDGAHLGKGRWQFKECDGGGTYLIYEIHNSDIDVFWAASLLKHDHVLRDNLKKLLLGDGDDQT